MKGPNHVHCAKCCYAVINEKASAYTQKKRELKWAAIQCACTYSEFHLALLNVSPNGDRLDFISWEGCKSGVRRKAV